MATRKEEVKMKINTKKVMNNMTLDQLVCLYYALNGRVDNSSVKEFAIARFGFEAFYLAYENKLYLLDKFGV